MNNIESQEYQVNEYRPSSDSNLSALGKIFDHSAFGEGFEAMARHVSQMSLFERMDFEDLELCGDKILAPHENTVDLPYYLTLDYLAKKIGEDLHLLEEYRNLLIELEADKATCEEFERWIREKGIAETIQYLKMLVSEMAACKPSQEDCLTRMREEGDDSFDPIGWHKVGSIHEEPEPLSWTAQQPEWYQILLINIDKAKDLEALAALGKKIYQMHPTSKSCSEPSMHSSMNLTHDQASVAFTRYKIRKNYLKGRIKLSPTARGLITKIKKANGNLGAIGAWLYKLQQGVIKIANLPSKHEWSIIWEAYRARKNPGMSPALSIS